MNRKIRGGGGVLHECYEMPLGRFFRVLCNTVQSGIGSTNRLDLTRGVPSARLAAAASLVNREHISGIHSP